MCFWRFTVGIWTHSYLKSSWLSLKYIFCLMMHQMFSIGERSGLQAGQFSNRTLLLRSHAVVIAAACGFALSCWNTQGLPWNRCHLEGSFCCSKPHYIPFNSHSTFLNMHFRMHLCTPISSWLSFELNADNTSPSSLAGGHGIRDFQQECQIWARLTIENFSTLKQLILNEPWPIGHDGRHSGLCLLTVVSGSISGPI